MGKARTYIIKGISGSYIIKILSVFLSLILSAFYSRLLGPKDYGLYSFALETILFISIPITLGLPTFISREIASSVSNKDYGVVKGVLIWSSRFVFIVSLIMTVVVVIFFSIIIDDQIKKKVLLYSIPIMILYGLGQIRMASLRGLKKVIKSILPDSIIRPILIICILFCCVEIFNINISAKNGIIIYIFCTIISFIIGNYWLFKNLPVEIRNTKPKFKKKLWIHEALPFFLLGGVALINTKLSLVMVGFFRPVEEVGFYKIAVVASNMVSFLMQSTNLTLGPLITELHLKKDYLKLEIILKKTVKYVFISGLSISIIYIVFGKVIITYIYGPEYIESYFPLIILTIGQLINSGAGSVGTVLNMTGYQTDTMKGHIIAALLNIVFNLILIPKIGTVGAAIATLISLICWNMLLLYYLKKRLNINSSII